MSSKRPDGAVLGGLKAMAELGKFDDPRCVNALELLESKQLDDRGWPAHEASALQDVANGCAR